MNEQTEPRGDPESRQHRCIQCGALVPETELYHDRERSDWACVDPDHPRGGGRNPICEDYDELTRSFMRVLYMFAYPNHPFLPGFDERVREYFQYSPLATHTLKALVSIAMQQRTRWGKPKAQRNAEDAAEVQRVMRLMNQVGVSITATGEALANTAMQQFVHDQLHRSVHDHMESSVAEDPLSRLETLTDAGVFDHEREIKG